MNINDEIITRYLSGECSPNEVAKLEEWRKAQSSNEKHFQDFELLWNAAGNFKYAGETDARASLQMLKEKAATQKVNESKVKNFRRINYQIAVAASVLLFAAGAWFYLVGRSIADTQVSTTSTVRVDTLSDGSVLTINKNSQLHFPQKFSGKQRQITLVKGEAFFHVKHETAKPFIIRAGKATIQVLGTSFNVKNNKGIVEVIVETGMVAVKKGDQTVLLKRGEKIFIKPGASILKKETNPDQLYAYYRTKEFVADNTPLWRMVEVLNEAYDSQIVIGRKELRNMPLNTIFKNESLEDILQVISKTFNLTIERQQQQIILK